MEVFTFTRLLFCAMQTGSILTEINRLNPVLFLMRLNFNNKAISSSDKKTIHSFNLDKDIYILFKCKFYFTIKNSE